MEPFSNYSDEPVFNIRAVTQQTQVDPATLRAWERRYNIPAPKRDVQGHRLYSERDIMILRWLKSQVDASVRIKQAVELLTMQTPQSLSDSAYAPTLRLVMAANSRFDQVVDDFISAIHEFNYSRAHQIITSALSIYPVEEVCLEILLPAVVQIGMEWEKGELTLQMEHFASNIIRERLHAMLSGAALPTRNGRIVIGCAPHEWHEIPAMMLALFMRRRGWEVIYLGQNVGLSGLHETLHSLRPQVFTLSVSRLPSVRYLMEAAHILTEATHHKGVFTYAGRVFSSVPELVKGIPGTYLGTSLLDAAYQLEQMLLVPPRNGSQPPQAVPQMQTTYEAVIQCRPALLGAINTLLVRHVTHEEYVEVSLAAHEIMEVILVTLQHHHPSVLDEMHHWAMSSLPSYGIRVNELADFVTDLQVVVSNCLPVTEADQVNQLLERLLEE